MARTGPGNGEYLRIGAGLQQGPAVFDAQSVVGAGQQGGIRRGQQGRDGPLPGGGKAVALGKLRFQEQGKFRVFQGLGGPKQRGTVPALAAEGQHINKARGGQHLHAAAGEALRGADGPGQGQL